VRCSDSYLGVMAFDRGLAERIRDPLVSESELTEKQMFGGLAILLDGLIAVAVSGQGGIMVRVDRDQTCPQLKGIVERRWVRGDR